MTRDPAEHCVLPFRLPLRHDDLGDAAERDVYPIFPGSMTAGEFMEIDSEAITEHVVVVAFDMCCSSNIIEDLSRTESLRAFDSLLRNLRTWLRQNSNRYQYAVYKFTGDGWILLFPKECVEGERLLAFLVALSKEHRRLYRMHIEGQLESVPETKGLTFGIEIGRIRKIKLDKQIEFVGRALNIACRLQGAVKDKGTSPDYRALMSLKVFNTFLKDVGGHKFYDVTRVLRNISGGENYRCKKLNLISALGLTGLKRRRVR